MVGKNKINIYLEKNYMKKLYIQIINKIYMRRYFKAIHAHWLYSAPKIISYPMWFIAQRWEWFAKKMNIKTQ